MALPAIAMCQGGCRVGDLAAIAAQVRTQAAAAKALGARLAVFAELTLTGYPPRDLLQRERFVAEQQALLRQLAAELPIACVMGFVEAQPGSLPPRTNALALLRDGKVECVYRKQLLPTYDVFDEARYFHPGNLPVIFTLDGARIGLSVCEDIWHSPAALPYARDPLEAYAGKIDLLLNASASPYHLGKPSEREALLGRVAQRIGAGVIYVNQVAGNDELLFDGGSLAVNHHGAVIARAKRWHTDVVLVRGDAAPLPEAPINADADLAAGLRFGVAEYCAKTHQRGVVLGLSGGIDSAVVATLAAQALGPANVVGLLLPSAYSSAGSLSDAEALARNLGIRSSTIPIASLVQAGEQALQPTYAALKASAQPGIAEENLQSRLRGTLIMAVANKLGLMALTTGNKSELAVGYCTIYGDMNGGLAPIGDLYKTEVYQLARWLNAEASAAGRVAPIPEASISKPPSAELRPDQTDEASLGSYADLDAILRDYLERDQGAAAQITAGRDAAMVQRTIRLVELNEWKRRQSAPVLRVSRKAFGVGRRVPLARGIEG